MLIEQEVADGMGDFAMAPGATAGELRAIWEEVLGVSVGDHDSFFELGGDSLTAARILARVRKSSGISLTILDIFDAPTLAEFSAAFDRSAAPPR
ncbi:phosphopantetheine-binding protein [Actinomadura opuntiae]|uniref:phosphopantetheine-binding protein n=1 Tax=Actinomadura sp. OS1-43 TaxID=604315 RepID=UPI00255A8141|nr:phosphopantetheine-binding protein [Actinomadura sp. OS1-43]MDL4817184.1 phosphopantetheine-binding protein [Actinomadura sp. OS1-43]